MNEPEVPEMNQQQEVILPGLTVHELHLVRTALKLLLSTLGKEEADELKGVQEILAKLPVARGS